MGGNSTHNGVGAFHPAAVEASSVTVGRSDMGRVSVHATSDLLWSGLYLLPSEKLLTNINEMLPKPVWSVINNPDRKSGTSILPSSGVHICLAFRNWQGTWNGCNLGSGRSLLLAAMIRLLISYRVLFARQERMVLIGNGVAGWEDCCVLELINWRAEMKMC